MAQITKAVAAEHRLEVSLIPEHVLKSIDQAELFDRLAYSGELTAKAKASPDAVLRRGYGRLARAVLQARPRAEVARESAALIAKAAGAPLDHQSAALRRKAELLLEEHPPAPRRDEAVPVAKAMAASPGRRLVYDASGCVLGLVDPAKLRSLPPAPRRRAGTTTR